MKRFIFGGLSLLLVLATTAPALKATAATVSPQIHTAMATSQTSVSPWLIRVTETRASKVAVVQPTTIGTAAVSTQHILYHLALAGSGKSDQRLLARDFPYCWAHC